MTPEAPKSLSRRKLLIGLGATGAVVGGGAAAAAILGGRNPENQARATQTPEAKTNTPATASPKVEPSPSKTPEPTPTKTPEAKAAPCTILSPESCSLAEVIKWTDSQGREYTSIALNLPPGTTIFAPVDGVLSKVQIKQPSPFQGIEVSINDSKSPTVNYALRGDIKPNSMTSENVKSGQNIGVIGNTGAKNFDKYNFSLDIVKPDPAQGRFVSEETILKTLFPTAFEKPIKKVAVQLNSAGQIITTYKN